MNRFQAFKAMLMYRKAVKLANKKHKETGKRYFVMPNIDTKIFLIVTDRTNFRRLRQKGYLAANMKLEDVFKRCFYYTSQSNGEGRNITEDELKQKQFSYQFWYAKRLQQIPAEKKRRKEQERLDKARIKALKAKFKAKAEEAEKEQEKLESERYDRIAKKYGL